MAYIVAKNTSAKRRQAMDVLRWCSLLYSIHHMGVLHANLEQESDFIQNEKYPTYRSYSYRTYGHARNTHSLSNKRCHPCNLFWMLSKRHYPHHS